MGSLFPFPSSSSHLTRVSSLRHRVHPRSHPLLLSIPNPGLSPRPPGITSPFSNGSSFTRNGKCSLVSSAQLCTSGFVLVLSTCTRPSLSLHHFQHSPQTSTASNLLQRCPQRSNWSSNLSYTGPLQFSFADTDGTGILTFGGTTGNPKSHACTE